MSREDDMKAESITGRFLDSHFYSGMKNLDGFERRADRESQFAGIDVQLSCGLKIVNIDEKCKYQGGYLNKTGVPSFEITRICRDGVRRPGWFVDENNKTDLYVFAYPKLRAGYSTEQDFLNDEHSVSAVELIMCPKKKITEYVEKFMSMDAVRSYADSMVRDHEFHDDIAIDGHIYLTRSEKYQESPVNMVIKLDVLSSLPGVVVKYVKETK